ncbi:MAG TPA: hypothetical protein VNQ73_14855 [Ilumatobacter sp.]|nr:hypothetical protein [Ilumatobacter sp.]
MGATQSIVDVHGHRWPPTLATSEAAEVWGVSDDTLYEQVRLGTAPVEPLRFGRKLRWPTAKVLDSVGIGTERAPRPAAEVTA